MKRFVVVTMAGALALAACNKAEDKKAAPEPTAATKTAPEIQPAGTAPAADAALLERGRYLADLMGCQQCHTPMGPQGPIAEKAWAGGLEIPEAFGTWRSPNITQDKETGIGGWTDEQILAAVREGKRPDGDQLFPIMPYPLYHALSNDDGKALVAYLRTIAPIANKVERATDLKMGKPPMPPAAGAAPDRTDEVAYGGYLAAIMHCAMCHSPADPKTHAPDMSKAFAGGFKFELPMFGDGALYSANLTPDKKTGIGEWTDEQLTQAIRAMTKRDGSVIVGPMALYQQGWYRMEDADVKALIAFLRSLPPVENPVPASTFKPKAPPPGAPGGAPAPSATGEPAAPATR